MSNKLQVGELALVGSNDSIYIIRHIIGDVAFLERVADKEGNPSSELMAISSYIKNLSSPIATIKASIQYYQTIVLQLMTLLDKYSPSNEGNEQET